LLGRNGRGGQASGEALRGWVWKVGFGNFFLFFFLAFFFSLAPLLLRLVARRIVFFAGSHHAFSFNKCDYCIVVVDETSVDVEDSAFDSATVPKHSVEETTR
jgi:hypothetical protein